MQDYYESLWTDHPHRIIIDWVAPNSRVLDIGCGGGQLGASLITRKHCVVTGVEPSTDRAARADQAGLSVIVGSIENSLIIDHLTAPYDVIIMADVLEHLVEPWKLLETCSELLSTKGHVLASVPNVAHFAMRARLAMGRFEYTEHGGLRDRTHLRFFTYNTARKMFVETGYQIQEMGFRWRFLTNDQKLPFEGILDRIVSGHPNLLAYQMLFKLKPAPLCSDHSVSLADS